MQIMPVRQNPPDSPAATQTGPSAIGNAVTNDAATNDVAIWAGALTFIDALAAPMQPQPDEPDSVPDKIPLSPDVAAQLLAAQAAQVPIVADPPTHITDEPPQGSDGMTDSFEYETMRAEAEDRLKKLMRRLGIPISTKVEISLSADGHVGVETADVHGDELETAINDDRDLGDVLAATDIAAHLARVAAEMQRAARAKSVHPAHADDIDAWMEAIEQSIDEMPVTLVFADGRLDAWFCGQDGRRLRILDDLVEPPNFF